MATERPLVAAMVLHEDSRGLLQRSKTTSNREISPAERHSAQQNSGLTERMPQKS